MDTRGTRNMDTEDTHNPNPYSSAMEYSVALWDTHKLHGAIGEVIPVARRDTKYPVYTRGTRNMYT